MTNCSQFFFILRYQNIENICVTGVWDVPDAKNLELGRSNAILMNF